MAERDEDGFVARWSRRKRQVEAEEDVSAPDPEVLEAEESARLAEEEANRLAAEAIDLDALKYGDDFSIFLKRGVPDLLRRRALRKFFASDPILANLDGLNDYDEDYTDPARKVYKSSWDVVRGYMTEADETVRSVSAPQEDAIKAPAASEEEPRATEEEPAEAPAWDEEGSDAGEEPDTTVQPEAPRRVSLRRRLEG
ncbi:DUF3306 domain-containing protein [Ostreiculturibacter nitratireducens]|uniref:DUF3306 domain-containing protein n=1 Tax=Ostreiculturibacter nitratireducens TaxID=3075226 RepID=UPI0031B60233